MRFQLAPAVFLSIFCVGSKAFIISPTSLTVGNKALSDPSSKSSFTALNAIGVLARKAKENDVRTYCEAGLEESVSAKYSEMKAKLDSSSPDTFSNIVQETLTKRKGTITIIAEYKRKFAGDVSFAGDEIFEPENVSPTFRTFGASAVAVLADERMGGCTYDDISKFVEEQEKAKGDLPGPLPVISNDLIVDEVQIARSAAYGAKAVVLPLGISGEEKTGFFIQCAKAAGIEPIVQVISKEEAQFAIDAGARIISVIGVKSVDDKFNVIDGLNVPNGESVCTIANIVANNEESYEEVEEAWMLRDKGFNAVWVSDVLYRNGNDPTEHAGAIIRSLGSKASVRWASAKTMSGKGEGSREYLGDILM